jgi:hypothetical protein
MARLGMNWLYCRVTCNGAQTLFQREQRARISLRKLLQELLGRPFYYQLLFFCL